MMITNIVRRLLIISIMSTSFLHAVAPIVVTAANILSAGVAYKIAVDPFMNKDTGGYVISRLNDLREATPEEYKFFLAHYPSMEDTKVYLSDELEKQGIAGCAFSDKNTIYMGNKESFAQSLKIVATDPTVYKDDSLELVIYKINEDYANKEINQSLTLFDHEIGHIIDCVAAKSRLLGTALATTTVGLAYLGHKLLGPIKKSKIPLTRCLMRIPAASALYLGYMGITHAYARYAEYVADANIRPLLIPYKLSNLSWSWNGYKSPEQAFPRMTPLLKKYVPQLLPYADAFCQKFLITHHRDQRINKLQKRYDLYIQQQATEAQIPGNYRNNLNKTIKSPDENEWKRMDGHEIQIWQELLEAEKQGVCTIQRPSKWINCKGPDII